MDRTIKRHWTGIVNWAKNHITNGILEGFNSLFQAAKAKARGYKKNRNNKSGYLYFNRKIGFFDY